MWFIKNLFKEKMADSLGPIEGSLEQRTYRFKNAAKTFYCPLCRTPRAMYVRPRVTLRGHLQLSIATAFFSLLFFPLMQWRAIFVYFFLWAALEMTVRLIYRKDVPCPHCGFDAAWYKRDVKEARRRVEEFWKQKQTVKNT